MLVKTKRQYKFQKALGRVDQCFQGFDESLVVAAGIAPGNDALIHFCKKGKFVFKVEFNDTIFGITQINDHLFAVAQVLFNQIWIIDLIKKSFQVFDHKFIYQTPCQAQIDYFCTSHLLCVRQYGYFGDKLTFTYFQISEEGEISKYAYYQTQKWNPNFQVRKIGNHSKFVWCLDRHNKIINAFQLQLEGDQPKFKQIHANLSYLFSHIEDGSLSITHMWGDHSNKLHIHLFFYNKLLNSAFCNIIVWNTETSQINLSRIFIDEEQMSRSIDIHAAESFLIYHSFKFVNQNIVETPVYYFRIMDGKQVGNLAETWTCSYKYKYFVSSNYTNQIIEACYENSIVNKIQMRTISYFDNEEISFALLSQLAPELQSLNDWDYDLLSDILGLLDYTH